MASFPVYAGYRYHPVQYGNGFLDILKSIGRFILPIFAGSAGNFLSGVSQRTNEGQSIAEAAKGSLKQAALTGGDLALKKLQSGGGRRKRKSKKWSHVKKRHLKKYKRANKRSKPDASQYNF